MSQEEQSTAVDSSARSDGADGRFLLEGRPHLQSVLAGAMGAEVATELEQLLSQVCPPRAPRRRVSIIGKLLRNVSDCIVEETVIVHDVSESGMRITLPAHVQLRLSEAIEPTFVLRVDDGDDAPRSAREWQVHGRFARLVGSRDMGVELAYVFVGLSESERRAVHHLAQWGRPRGTGTERPRGLPSNCSANGGTSKGAVNSEIPAPPGGERQ